MATDERIIKSLQNIAENLERLGVRSEDLKNLKRHLGQQKRQMNKWYVNKYGRDSYKKIRR